MSHRELLDLEIDSDLTRVAEACRVWEQLAGELALDAEAAAHIELALCEAVNNAIIHAYRRQPGYRVRVCVGQQGSRLIVAVVDYGTPMPGGLPQAEPLGIAGRHNEGGRGLGIIQSLMWDVTYRAGPDGNALEMQYPLS